VLDPADRARPTTDKATVRCLRASPCAPLPWPLRDCGAREQERGADYEQPQGPHEEGAERPPRARRVGAIFGVHGAGLSFTVCVCNATRRRMRDRSCGGWGDWRDDYPRGYSQGGARWHRPCLYRPGGIAAPGC
jgi:hypothetical protein